MKMQIQSLFRDKSDGIRCHSHL